MMVTQPLTHQLFVITSTVHEARLATDDATQPKEWDCPEFAPMKIVSAFHAFASLVNIIRGLPQ